MERESGPSTDSPEKRGVISRVDGDGLLSRGAGDGLRINIDPQPKREPAHIASEAYEGEAHRAL